MVTIPTHLLNIFSAGNMFAQMPQLPTKFFSPGMYPKNNKQAKRESTFHGLLTLHMVAYGEDCNEL
jgi:hypothetical protein